MHENVARYKLPAVGDGREVLTSAARLKYTSIKLAFTHHVYMLNKKSRLTGIQEIIRIFNFEV